MTTETATAPARSNGKPRRELARKTYSLARTVHVYLTMLALTGLLFFSCTGFILNHDKWFAPDEGRSVTTQATIPAAVLQGPDHKLQLVEHLRSQHGVTGALKNLTENNGEFSLEFLSPARKTSIDITADRQASIETTTYGWAGWLTDLHRGKRAGGPWGLLIDAVAISLFLASLTGLVLFISLPKRRKLGLTALALGLGLPVVMYFLLMP